MPNQRKQGKKKIGVWVEDDEKAQIDAELKKHGVKNVAELLKLVREGRIKISPAVQALLIGIGSEQSGCGGLLFLLLAAGVAAMMLL